MNKQEMFYTEVVERLKKMCDENHKVAFNKITKTNNTVFNAVSIRGEGERLAPVFYLDDYYNEYVQGFSINDIAKYIYDKSQDTKKATLNHFDINLNNFFDDFDSIKDKVIFQLINQERNKELLDKTPHIPFCDLAIVFKVLVSMEEDEAKMGKILITNNLLNKWNVDADTLYKLARENSQTILPGYIKPMSEIVSELVGKNDIDLDLELILEEENDMMFVATNKNGIDGATVLLYDDLIHDFAEQINDDLYIIPSSIHEVLLLSQSHPIKTAELKEMVHDVNSTQVPVDEILSNNVYSYTRDTKTYSIVE